MTFRIYTRTGDKGNTRLGDGRAIDKDSARVEALGAIDELNAWLGVLAAQKDAHVEAELIGKLQSQLFRVGAEVATPGSPRITPGEVTAIEQSIDRIESTLPELRNFILPGGTSAGAYCHLARTVCRRAERALFRLARDEEVNSESLKYINRLSDLLFVLARKLVRQAGAEEVLWKED